MMESGLFSSAESDHAMPKLSGTVYHYANLIKGWRPRHLSLSEGILRWRKLTDSENTVRGELNVSALHVIASDDPHEFVLDVASVVAHLKVENPLYRDKWVKYIKRSSDMLQKIAENIEDEKEELKPGMIEMQDDSFNTDGLQEQVRLHNTLISGFYKMRDSLKRYEVMKQHSDVTINHLLLNMFGPEDKTITEKEKDELIANGISELVSLGINVMTSQRSLWNRQLRAEGVINQKMPIDEEAATNIGDLSIDQSDEDDENLDDEHFFEPVSTLRNLKSKMKIDLPQPGLADIPRSKEKSFHAIARRLELPPQKQKRVVPSLISIMKETVGKDLATVELPITLCEPITILQRAADDLEYSELLDKAAATSDSGVRLALAGIFAVSHYCSSDERFDKPFSSYVGETYELSMPEKGEGFRVVMECISKVPTTYALHAESLSKTARWKYYYSLTLNQKFYGKTMELYTKGKVHIEFPDHGDHITFPLPTTIVHNVVFGKMWVDNFGDLTFTNHHNKEKLVLCLLRAGWKSSANDVGSLEGIVTDKNGKPRVQVQGSWRGSISYQVSGGKPITVFEKNTRLSPSASRGYHFTDYTVQLNEMLPGAEKSLPPTDSRRRPDVRASENGEFEKAQAMRTKLASSQEKVKVPVWFQEKTDTLTGEPIYMFTEEYWECRKNGDWSRSPQLHFTA